jgi:hypothetical protein
MGSFAYHIYADWDPEAGAWIAPSDEVPGLATEAPTTEALSKKLRVMIPELLESNHLLLGGQPDAIAFEPTRFAFTVNDPWRITFEWETGDALSMSPRDDPVSRPSARSGFRTSGK